MLDSLAPALGQYLFGVHRRVIMSDALNETIQREITRIFALSAAPGRAKRTASRPKA
jgi:hypothetical protein